MCFGGGNTSSGTQYQVVGYTDPTSGATNYFYTEAGVPGEYAARGATTVSQYQTMASQDLSDKQIAANQKIADASQAFNEKQFQAEQDQWAQQQSDTKAQADRQSTYDTGRATLLSAGEKQINDAFSKFTPDYFDQYAKDYMSKAQDEIDYQKTQATKDLAFGLARQGIGSSQAGVNETGLIDETAGRAAAQQTSNAQSGENTLKTNVTGAKQNLLGQVTSAESIGSPIAGSSVESVNSALDTTKSAISGVTSTAGDTVSSLSAVPTVSSLSNIFSGILGSTGNLVSGVQSAAIGNAVSRGLSGTSPSGSSSTKTS